MSPTSRSGRETTGAGPRGPVRAVAPRPHAIFIGASTGGPQALMQLIGGMSHALRTTPVCVSLHMPSELMQIVADHVARACEVPTEIIVGRRAFAPGTVYFAPGVGSVCFARSHIVEVDLVPAQSDGSQHDVDAMFMSAARVYGSRTLGIVLSGMGRDGLVGARAIVEAGGQLIVQDKQSSAVWGMPGCIFNSNLTSMALAPAAIAREVVLRLSNRPRAS